MYPNLVEYSNIENYMYLIKANDNDIKKLCCNMNLSINDILVKLEPLQNLKIEYMNKIIRLKSIFDKLELNERTIIRLYFIKNKPSDEVASMLNISVRTFFRRIAVLEKKIEGMTC